MPDGSITGFKIAAEISISSGTGDYILSGAVPGCLSFQEKLNSSGVTIKYIASYGRKIESGVGLFISPNILRSTRILSSSDGNEKISWPEEGQRIISIDDGVSQNGEGKGLVLEGLHVLGKLGVGTETPDVYVDIVGNIMRFGGEQFPAKYTFLDTGNCYFVMDRLDSYSDASIVFRNHGNARGEIGIFGSFVPNEDDDFQIKTVSGDYLSEIFTTRFQLHAKTQVDGSLAGTSDFFGPGPLRRYAQSGRASIIVGTLNGREFPDGSGTGLEIIYSLDNDEAIIQAITWDLFYRNITVQCNGFRVQTGPVNLNTHAFLINSNGAVILDEAFVLAETAFVSNSGAAGIALMEGYVPGGTEILTAVGGTGTAPTFSVTTTQISDVVSIVNPGSGGVDGIQIITGTTGTGTKFQWNVMISGGSIVEILDPIEHGSYSVNPSSLTNEPITGGGLSSAAVAVHIGAFNLSLVLEGKLSIAPTTPVSTTSNLAGVGATIDIQYQNGLGSLNFADALWANGVKSVDKLGNYISLASPRVVYIGDDRTADPDANGLRAYSNFITLPKFQEKQFSAANVGISGTALWEINQNRDIYITQQFYIAANENIFIIWAGVNDGLYALRTAAQMYADIMDLSTYLKDLGGRVIICKEISAVGFDVIKNDFNDLIDGDSSFADGVADLSSDVNIGADGAYSNTTYFSTDQIHLSQVGYEIVAVIIQTAIEDLLTALTIAPDTARIVDLLNVPHAPVVGVMARDASNAILPDALSNLGLGTEDSPNFNGLSIGSPAGGDPGAGSLAIEKSLYVGGGLTNGIFFEDNSVLSSQTGQGVILLQALQTDATAAIHLAPSNFGPATGTIAEITLVRTLDQAFGGNYGRWSFTTLGTDNSNVSGIYGEFGGTVTPTEFIFNIGYEDPPSTFASYEPMRLMAGANLGNVGFGVGATVPREAIQLHVAALGSPGTLDSHSIRLVGVSNDGSSHTVNWSFHNNVTSNAGDSKYILQTRKDSDSYVTKFSLTDTGDLAEIATLTAGTSAPITTASSVPAVQGHGVWGLGGFRWNAGVGGGNVVLAHSRSATVGTQSALTLNDRLGSIVFQGSDGTDFVNDGARIAVEVDDTVSTGITPTRLILSTMTSSGVSTEALRIDSAQVIKVATAFTVGLPNPNISFQQLANIQSDYAEIGVSNDSGTNYIAMFADPGSGASAGHGIYNTTGPLLLEPANDIVGFGGHTSAFPALKRSSTTLQVRLADDSGYTTLDVGTLNDAGAAPTGTAGSGYVRATSPTITNPALTDPAISTFVACTSTLTKTSNTTLDIVTGLAISLTAGKTYHIRGWLNGTSGSSGGIKVAVTTDGVLTATRCRINGLLMNGATVVANTTITALGNNIAANTAIYTDLYIEGTIVVNIAGMLYIAAAQNVSDGTATTVLIDSNFSCTRIN